MVVKISLSSYSHTQTKTVNNTSRIRQRSLFFYKQIIVLLYYSLYTPALLSHTLNALTPKRGSPMKIVIIFSIVLSCTAFFDAHDANAMRRNGGSREGSREGSRNSSPSRTPPLFKKIAKLVRSVSSSPSRTHVPQKELTPQEQEDATIELLCCMTDIPDDIYIHLATYKMFLEDCTGMEDFLIHDTSYYNALEGIVHKIINNINKADLKKPEQVYQILNKLIMIGPMTISLQKQIIRKVIAALETMTLDEFHNHNKLHRLNYDDRASQMLFTTDLLCREKKHDIVKSPTDSPHHQITELELLCQGINKQCTLECALDKNHYTVCSEVTLNELPILTILHEVPITTLNLHCLKTMSKYIDHLSQTLRYLEDLKELNISLPKFDGIHHQTSIYADLPDTLGEFLKEKIVAQDDHSMVVRYTRIKNNKLQ